MKIGVLTYHKTLSQGATFQAYATYRALKELGCDVEIIDLSLNIKSPRPKWQVMLLDVYMSLAYHRQEVFRKTFYPRFSKHYNTLEELRKDPPKVDAVCVGSDQTWNKGISSQENFMAYFLDFGPESMPRFSYASSFGFSEWKFDEGEETKRIGEMLNKYVGLSVRETTAHKMISEKFGLDASIVCDPTILHADYNEFTKGLKQRDEVVCYSLSTSRQPKLQAIEDISKFMGVPIRWMGKPFFVKGAKYTYFPDVYRWFRVIASSKFVLTDSFHGVVASILCQKPFVVLYEDNGLSSRIVDLLTKLGLQDRIFFNYDDFSKSDSWKKPIDYNKINVLLDEFRKTSWDYLKKVINEISIS